MEPAVGRPGPAGHCVLAHKPDAAAARPSVRLSKSAADRIIDHLGPALALQLRKRFRGDTVLIVDGTLVPTRDHAVAAQSKNYRYSTNHQVVIDAVTHRDDTSSMTRDDDLGCFPLNRRDLSSDALGPTGPFRELAAVVDGGMGVAQPTPERVSRAAWQPGPAQVPIAVLQASGKSRLVSSASHCVPARLREV